MKHKLIATTWLFIVALYTQSIAQTPPVVPRLPLKVGDTVPDYRFDNLVNSDKAQFKLSELKTELIILDFWATWCGACIGKMKFTEEIKDKYRDKVSFIPITYEEPALVKKALKRHDLNTFSVVKDTIFRKIFPHTYLPHYIWIYDRKIIAITSYKELREENIIKALAVKSLDLLEKNDLLLNREHGFNVSQGVLNRQDTTFLKSKLLVSSVSKFDPRLSVGQSSFNTKQNGITVWNTSIQQLFQLAYGEEFLWHRVPINITYLEVDSSQIDYYLAERSNADLFCYNLVLDKSFMDKQRNPEKAKLQIMREDLSRTFGLNAKWELKQKKCLILSTIDSGLSYMKLRESIYRESGELVPPSVLAGKSGIRISQKPITEFIQFANNIKPISRLYPLIDETNIKGNVNLDMLFENYDDWYDVTLINRRLSKYGLQIIEGVRDVNMLVIRDNTKI